MARLKTAERQPPLEHNRFANNAVTLEAAPPASRISFRATPKGATAFGKYIGLALPTKPGTTASKAGINALWIGPDEWFVFSEKSDGTSLMPRGSSKEYSAVDISHRNTAFIVSGPGASNTLNAACPRDLSLSAFPVKTASRTILGKAEVILYRTAKDTFRVECWRSFAPYVWTYLVDGAKDAHI